MKQARTLYIEYNLQMGISLSRFKILLKEIKQAKNKNPSSNTRRQPSKGVKITKYIKNGRIK